MFEGLRRLFRRAPGAPEPGSLVEELWLGAMTGAKEGRFLELEDPGYSARYQPAVEGGRLELSLERPDLFAWTEAPLYRHSDFVLEGRFGASSGPEGSACGFLFRYQDEGDFYALLVSDRRHFRLDLVLGGKPRPLIAWTELPPRPEGAQAPGPEGFSLRVIARGEHFTICVDGTWVAEAVDGSFDSGFIAFAAQRYGAKEAAPDGVQTPARFALDSVTLESRPVEVEAWYYKWNYLVAPGAGARRALAETFFAMGEFLAAAVQLRKLERLRSLDADELFLKAESALRLGLRDEAEASLDACLALDPGRAEAAEEKANLLYLQGRYPELEGALEALLAGNPENPRLLGLSGHARFNLGDFAGAAERYGRAADLADREAAANPAGGADRPIGGADRALYRMNEARAWDQAKRRLQAAGAYLAAARLFSEQEADEDLALALARLSALSPRSPEAKEIRAKALYRSGKREEARLLLEELAAKGQADSGSRYTLGLILAERGLGAKALEHFKAALELEPDYPLYAFRYAERLFLQEHPDQEGVDPSADSGTGDARRALERALELSRPEEGGQSPGRGPVRGWVLNLAGQEALSRGDLEAARTYLEAASAALPGVPEPAINLADLESREGRTQAALDALAPFPEIAACRNQAGNALARAAEAARAAKAAEAARAAEAAPAPGGEPDAAEALLESASREYFRAASLEPGSAVYQANLAAAYLELERYSEAEERIRRALDLGGGARTLLLAGNLAKVYGDLPRAEAAYRLGLEASPRDPALLLALGRAYLGLRKPQKAQALALRLEEASSPLAARLRAEIEEATTEALSCASCGRIWRTPRDLPPQSASSLRAMPPDDSPAGACPRCGKVYCIACRKAELSPENRFTCPDCGEDLKLSDNRLRYLVRRSLRVG